MTITAPARPSAGQRTLWAWAIATFFGIGLIKRGGGTVAAVIVAGLWISIATNTDLHLVTVVTTALALIASVVGIFASAIVAKENGIKDPSKVVVDEVAGQLIALLGAPVDWKYVLASLILFRALDIMKPFPVRQLERMPGGLGIMMDDVVAGLITLVLLQSLYRFLL